MADDKDKPIVLKALEKAGWTITHPKGIRVQLDDKTGIVDIGAEIYIAEKGMRKIAVEVKNYPPTGDMMGDFQRSIGQCRQYMYCLSRDEPDREVYKAVPKATYEGFLKGPEIAAFVKHEGIKLLVYDPDTQEIDQWPK